MGRGLSDTQRTILARLVEAERRGESFGGKVSWSGRYAVGSRAPQVEGSWPPRRTRRSRTNSAVASRALARLERRGLLERIRPYGRRTWHVALTDAGRAAAEMGPRSSSDTMDGPASVPPMP